MRRAGLLLAVCVWPAVLQAGVQLEVAGSVQPSADALEVRLVFANRGDAPATSVDVDGELLGHHLRGRLVAIPAGEERVLLFRYPAEVPRPGVHPLTLLADYGAGTETSRASQCLFLLLALGETTEPAVTLAAAEVLLDTWGPVRVSLRSADARPHRIRLRLVTARGLFAGESVALDVPAAGTVAAHVDVLRAGAPRGSRQGVLLIAQEEGSGPARTTVLASVVQVGPDPAWMPKLRIPLVVLAALLLIAAFVKEARAGRPASP